MTDDASIRKLFSGAGVMLSQNDVWAVQGTPVVKHKALERLAAAMKIKFDAPQVLRAERDEAVLLVTGQLATVTEWSIGEAIVNVNYRVTGKMAAYVYAMAEKRAKDRVILKLAGLHGVYSEEEADEFKDRGNGPTMTELLTDAETALTQAAKYGIAPLRASWDRLDPDLKPALKTRLEELKKHAATIVEKETV